MKEYVIWATDPKTLRDRPISEKVYNKLENDRRVAIAKKNAWKNVHTQVMDLSDNNFWQPSKFIKR